MKRQHTANFKAQLVQELLKEDKTIAQIAAEYEERSVFPGEKPLYSQLKSFYPTWQQKQTEREWEHHERGGLARLVAHMEGAKRDADAPVGSGVQDGPEVVHAPAQHDLLPPKVV